MSENKSRSKRWLIAGVVLLGLVGLFGLAILSLVIVGSGAPASAPRPAPTMVREMIV